MDVYRLATYACEEDLLEISDKYIATFAKKELAFLRDAPQERATRDRLGLLRHQSKLSDDKDMQMKLGIVARLGSKLPAIVDDMIRRCVDQKRHESAHFLLVDGAQGEGPRVPVRVAVARFRGRQRRVARRGARYVAERNDGFGESVWEEVDSDEINLLYVAATRARRELFLPRSAAQVHGGFPALPEGSRRAAHNLGHDAVGRLVQGGPGSVVALRALGGLGDSGNPSPGGETRREKGSGEGSGPRPSPSPRRRRGWTRTARERRVEPRAAACCARRGATTCATSAREVAKFAPEGAGSGAADAGRACGRSASRSRPDARRRGHRRIPPTLFRVTARRIATSRRRHGRVVGRPRGPRARERPRGVPPARARPPRRRRAPGVRHLRHARGVVAPVRVPGVPGRGAAARRLAARGTRARPRRRSWTSETRSRRSPRRRARRRGRFSRRARRRRARAAGSPRGRAGRRRRRGRRGRRVFVSRRVSPLFDFYQVPFRELSC